MTGGGVDTVVNSKDSAAGSSQAGRKAAALRHKQQPANQDTTSSSDSSIKEEEATAMESVWVFGYGSLLWKINFPYEDKIVGYVKGFARRFWQGSTDHRGVPGAPGRVVTLIEAAEEETWGIAYKVLPSDVPDVMAYLDHRERGGYTTHKLVFYPESNDPNKTDFSLDDKKQITLTVLAYVATERNPNYLGPAPIEDVAKQVVDSRGPSGCNTEYMLNLAHSMREIAPGVDDKHLFSLEGKVREQLEVRLRVRVTTSKTAARPGGEERLHSKEDIPIDGGCTCSYCLAVSSASPVPGNAL